MSPSASNNVFKWSLIVLTLVAAWFRWSKIEHPVRYDEGFNVLLYASSSDPAVWVEYSATNNHVLHTLAMVGVGRVFGLHPAGMRLPAWLAALALVPMGAWLAWVCTGSRWAALSAAGLLAFSGQVTEFSVNARGYTMICLFTVWMAGCTVRWIKGDEKGDENHTDRSNRSGASPFLLPPLSHYLPWILAGALGLFTIPIMILPVALFAGLLLIDPLLRQKGRSAFFHRCMELFLAVLAMGVVTLILYLPSIRVSGLGSIVANDTVQPQSLSYVLHLAPIMGWETLVLWAGDLGLFTPVILLGLMGVIWFGWKQRNAFGLIPLIAPLILAAIILAGRVAPFPRLYFVFLPLLLVLATVGWYWFAQRVPDRSRPRVSWMICALIAATALWEARICSGRQFLITNDPHTLVDAETIVEDAKAEFDLETLAIVSQIPSSPSLAYYVGLGGGGRLNRNWREFTPQALVVVGPGQTLEGVMNAPENPHFNLDAGDVVLWKTYPYAEVYLVTQKVSLRLRETPLIPGPPPPEPGHKRALDDAIQTGLSAQSCVRGEGASPPS